MDYMDFVFLVSELKNFGSGIYNKQDFFYTFGANLTKTIRIFCLR